MKGVHVVSQQSWHPQEGWLLRACPSCQNQLASVQATHWSCLKASETEHENFEKQLQIAITSS